MIRLLAAAFAREVRGSNPLGVTYKKRLREALVGDAQHQNGDVVTRALLLEVQNGALYTVGNG